MPKHESFGEQHHHPEKQENTAERYAYFLSSYDRTSRKMKALQRLYPVPGDPETTEKIIELDKDRHETHLQLLEMGHKLGKDQGDVLIDLIRQQRTLEEYGLPEFSILTEEDVLMGDDWHQSYYFNVDTVACLPNEGDKIGWDGNENEDKSLLSKDQFMLVFSIVPIENYGEDELEPDDYAVRLKRAKAFAENMGGKIFEQRDSSYHEASAKILGVIFPKKDVEKIAGTIRDNPEKFRLGKEFYSSEELSLLKNEENE